MIVLLQRKLIYRPRREPVRLDETAVLSAHVRSVGISTGDGLTLHGWHATSRHTHLFGDPSERLLVIFYPGNSGHRGMRQRDVELFTQLGADLLLVDYRGYGENRGKPSEAMLAMDAHAVWRFAVEKLGMPPHRIVLFGGSLGTGVATRLAHELCAEGSSPAALILRSAFTSLIDAGKVRYPWLPVKHLLVERFLSIERISSVTCPLLIVHGTQDRVVPIEQGRQLFAKATPRSACGMEKRFVELPNSGHNDIIHTGWDEMSGVFGEFLQKIADRAEVSQGGIAIST